MSRQTPHRRRDVRPARRCAPRRRTRWRKTLTMVFFCESGPTRAEGVEQAVDADSVHTCTLSLSHQQSVRPPKPQPLDAPGDVAMKWPDSCGCCDSMRVLYVCRVRSSALRAACVCISCTREAQPSSRFFSISATSRSRRSAYVKKCAHGWSTTRVR